MGSWVPTLRRPKGLGFIGFLGCLGFIGVSGLGLLGFRVLGFFGVFGVFRVLGFRVRVMNTFDHVLRATLVRSLCNPATKPFSNCLKFNTP